MTDQSTAVAVFDPAVAARELSRELRKKSTGIAALLGVDPTSDDPKEAAKAKAMLDRFLSVAIHATSDPSIRKATIESLVGAVRDSALLGLEPVGSTGDGAIVVYEESVKTEKPSPSGRAGATIVVWEKIPTAHFQPMYRGLLKLARRSGEIAHVDAHVVYQGDQIELDLGSQPSVKHFPVLDGSKRGGEVGAYAVAELVNGRRYVEWMTKADIEEVRKSSRGGQSNDSPWTKFWSEMARKTVLRRLMKRLPLETMAEHALRLETEQESGPRLVAGPEPVGGLLAAGSSSARKRLRARFGKDDESNGADEDAGTAPTSPPDSAPTSPAGSPPVSVDPRATEPPDVSPEAVAQHMTTDQIAYVRGETDDSGDPPKAGEVCGATTDPRLGDVETCNLPPSHGGTLHEATDAAGNVLAKWPNR